MLKSLTGIALLIACWIAIAPAAVMADPMPTQDDVSSDRDVLVQVLVEQGGVDADTAAQSVADLSDDEVAVLVDQPDLVQAAGAMPLDLWTGGVWLLGTAVGLSLIFLAKHND